MVTGIVFRQKIVGILRIPECQVKIDTAIDQIGIADKIVVIADGKVQNVGEKDKVLPKLLGAESCRVLTDKL